MSGGHGLRALVVGALGVVFGDIGTSPLYTFQECLHHHRLPIQPDNVLGVISLIFWALTLVVTVKYVAVLMDADNHGEGGIMALLALVPAELRMARAGRVGLVSLMVIAGAALMFGDGVITPAISVLSALEGLAVASPGLERAIVPATCAILFLLFAVQKRGTGALGVLFGPVMLLWFLVIGVLGLASAWKHPAIFGALSPHHAVEFFRHHGFPGLGVLGSVVLAVTGGEALYADMGHFGKRPIRVAWLAIAYPCLVCCYFGQGALLLGDPKAAAAPFFALVPPGPWAFALVVLATMATIIASQGLISAMFSLTHQAVRLGYLPRVSVLHTSSEVEGRIYVPLVNWALMIACLALVLAFRESGKLAAAFGLAVSGTMAITSVVFYFVMRSAWGWSRPAAMAVLALFLAVDVPFCVATCLKFFDGGYLPFALGLVLFVAMSTWCAGRSLVREQLESRSEDISKFIEAIPERTAHRLPGLAAVMSASSGGTPPALNLMVQRFRTIHEHVFLLTVTTEPTPYAPAGPRVVVTPLARGFFRVSVRYGFMEVPSVPAAIAEAIAAAGLAVDAKDVVYVLTRESFSATSAGKMGTLREQLFAFLSRNATNPSHTFRLPADQVVEVGFRMEL